MSLQLTIAPKNVQQLAMNFLGDEWNLSASDREWLAVITARLIGERWYVIEVGVTGIPDTWVIQVYNTGECDPDYTFVSPISTLAPAEAELMPTAIAAMLEAERYTLSSTLA